MILLSNHATGQQEGDV